jgi:hypothetical protein
MSLDVSVAHEVACTRISLRGDPKLGRVLSLLHVLEIDSATWPRSAVLLDLRELKTRLSQDEQVRLAWEAAHALRRMKKVALLAPPGRLREGAGTRVFDDEEAARRWLGEA